MTTDFGRHDHGRSVGVQSDGKVVVAGYSNIGSDFDFALVRYEGDPVDLDLDDDGLLDSWEVAHFGTTVGHSALDETDDDGRVELLELAFGAHPLVADPGATPVVIIEAGYLTTTIAKPPAVTYLVQTARRRDEITALRALIERNPLADYLYSCSISSR
ncbi:MAG: delta-60 repeat domain-containing protein [Verrucomicrobiales bacterium]